MTGPVAQFVALACHANAVMRGRRVPRFFPNNSTCIYCDSIAFVRLKRRLLFGRDREEPLAPGPDAWFEQLRSDARTAAMLRHAAQDTHGIKDRMTAGWVGGGGLWALELHGREGCDRYESGWQVWNQDAPEQRIWRVTYARVGSGRVPPAAAMPDLASLKAELCGALRPIEDFARRMDLGGFAGCFQKALDCLESREPFALVYHKDLAPDGLLGREAAQLLAAAQAAGVFGGMGSWNDLAFEGADQQTYESLSDRLFGLVNQVICAATNTTAA